MNIDFTHFTPWASLAGGLLIGLGAAIYLLANGRDAGIAGIVASPLRALLAGKSLAPDINRLLFILAELPKDRPVLLICNTQNRSRATYDALRQRGYTNL